jgi:CRP-like cAMP-binding protein
MSVAGAEADVLPNQLLTALPEAERSHVTAQLESVDLRAGQVLYDAGRPPLLVFFPDDALISVLGVAEGRMTLEVGLIGREGMLGAALGVGEEHAHVRAIVQRAGRAWRMAVEPFRALVAQHASLQRLLHRYTEGQLAQAIQIAVCSRYHVLEARLARTLLVTRDRLHSDRFHMTHEFLSHALGVRRVGVTKAASALQQQGLINYSRGNIEILDPDGLVAASCACYEVVKEASGAGPDGAADSDGQDAAS